MIRKIEDSEIVVRIPAGVLQPKYDHPKRVVKHFLWLSNRTFKVINHDSLEKIFEITPEGTLKTLGYGALPMLYFFHLEDNENYHYYKDRQHKNIEKSKITYLTLVRKMQQFYSA